MNSELPQGPQQSKAEAELSRLMIAAADAARSLSARIDIVRAQQAISLELWQETSAEIGEELAVFRRVTAGVNDHFGLTSAKARLLRYLQTHLGEAVTSDQLAGVAGIHEWARRVRELRVEDGWQIETGVQDPNLRPDEYRLTSAEPRAALADRWRLARGIRNETISGRDRLLKFLTAISPEPADKDELSYVAKIKDWPRRIPELQEAGWQVDSNLDDPNLAPGSYRMLSTVRNPPRVRRAMKLRHQVMERDGFRCRDCGRTAHEARKRFEVHHLVMVSEGGTNEAENLVTLCSDCHAGRHALRPGQTVDELLEPGDFFGT